MSVVTKNYKVEFINFNSSYVFQSFVDITDFVVSLDDFVLQSTGKISTAKFTLNGEFGNFITNDNSGVTPKIKQFDLIRITIIGDDGVTEQNKIFEVTTDLAQITTRSSYFLPIEMEGRERNLAGVPFGGFFRSATHNALIAQVVSSYNNQHKTLQPALFESDDNDAVPDFNPNIWDFTQVDNCFDAILVVLASLNLPVSAGGGGNRYALIFEDVYSGNTPTLGNLEFRIIKQGSRNPSVPTLQQNDAHPITKIDKIKHPATGSIVVARGRPKTGTQPQNYSLFLSKLEFYRNIKQWDSSITYPVGSYVTFGRQSVNEDAPQRWQAMLENTNSTPAVGLAWQLVFVGNFIGNIQYSPWTIMKATPIQNGFANPGGDFSTTTTDAVAIPDHNLVINDVRGEYPDRIGTYRNWVTFRTNTSVAANLTATEQAYLYQGSFFYDGQVVLVDPNVGALGGVFSGSDPNGILFEGSMAIWRATPNSLVIPGDGDWFVLREVQDFDQCAVYAEAKVYEWNVFFDKAQAGAVYPGADRRRGGAVPEFEWRDISDVFMGNDCFHNPFSIKNVTGLVASVLADGEPLTNQSAFPSFPYNENSGIEIVFGYNQANETQQQHDVWFNLIKKVITGGSIITQFLINLIPAVYNTYTTPQYTNMGWWFTWPSPYPFSTVETISEDVGELYGGNFATLNDHRYFDLFNIQYTTTGLEGWTHVDSSDLSEITGVEFLFNFDITISDVRIPFSGDVPFAYWCIDKFGTMWKSPKIMYRHLGETQSVKIEFGDLSPVFRGRTPLGIDNVLENIIVAEVEVNEVFFKDTIIIQGFQCETPYDEFGRYAPNLFEQIIKPVFFDIFVGGSSEVRFIGVIDAFGFTKTPVAISNTTTLSSERTIIPQFEDYQNILNVEQLQRFADAKNQIDEFQYEQYTIVQGGINDLDLEDSIFLKDPYLIDESDDGANTRKLAIRELHYSVPADSGLIRKMIGVKVIDV